MAYSQEVFYLAKERLAERRQRALDTADLTREQLYREIPRLREINSELLSIGASTAKAMLRASDDRDSIKRLSERSLALQEEQEKLLALHHIGKEALEPRFHCAVCDDTGYVERDNRTEICDCLIKLMADITAERLNEDLPLDDCTFESFDPEYYSKSPDANGNIPYNRMTKIYHYCIDYAENFSLSSKSIFMKGATGLGKTHLSLAIANVVIGKGMSVIYTSAPRILSKLEKEHFSYRYDEQEDTYNSLLKCDLLILDDLGTEFVTDFTRSCIYNLFNSRIMEGKPIIISSNLSLSELVNMYAQRFVSRLIGSCDRLDFIGEDIRPRK